MIEQYVINIEWDTDGDNPEVFNLPQQVKCPVKVWDSEDGADRFIDELSDEHGFCIYSAKVVSKVSVQ